MNFSRRVLLTSTMLSVGIHLTPAFAAQSNGDAVTSGGIGLRLADIQSMYEEGPVGQSFRTFMEPQSNTTLYIDFGTDDLAQTIYVSGDIDTSQAEALVRWLVLDDAEDFHAFSALASAGSIAQFNALTMVSPSLAEYTNNRVNILATWQVDPDGSAVTNLMIMLQQENDG